MRLLKRMVPAIQRLVVVLPEADFKTWLEQEGAKVASAAKPAT